MFELNKPNYYTPEFIEEIDGFDKDDYGNTWFNVKFEGDAMAHMWLAKNEPEVGKTVYGHLEKTKSGKRSRFRTDKPPEGPTLASTPATPGGENKYLKDITDLPARFIQSLLPYYDVQSLKPDTDQYFALMKLAKALASDAAQMIEELRTGSLSTDTTPGPETKAQSKAAGDLKSKLAESHWDPNWAPDDEVHE